MAGVDISVDVGSILGVTLTEVSPATAEALEERLEQVRADWDEELLAFWPVDTGLSLGEWESTVIGLQLILRNPVDYSEWVRPSGEPIGYGVEHMTEVRDRLLAEALPEMRRLIEADRSVRVIVQRPRAIPPTPTFVAFTEAFIRRPGSVRRRELPRLLTGRLTRRRIPTLR